MFSDFVNVGTQPRQRYIKRIPLTIGLMLVSLLGFIAALDIPNILVENTTGSSAQSTSGAIMLGLGVIYLIIGLIAILAIALIWRGIAEWPLDQN
jgi:hypothetical protein